MSEDPGNGADQPPEAAPLVGSDAGAPHGGQPPIAAGAMAPPQTIALALAAIYTQLLFAALSAVLAFALGNELRSAIITSNNKATGSNKKALCVAGKTIKDCLNVTGTLHSLQLRTAIGTVVVCGAIIAAVIRIRRGTRSGRTMFLIFSFLGTLIFFAGSPLDITAAFTAGPVPPRIVETVAGLAAIAGIVLLFLRPSQQFFDNRSPRAGRATGGGLGALFGNRPPIERKPAPSSGLRSTAQSRAQGRLERSAQQRDVEAIARSAAADRNRAKAKARNDAESIARGAALARDRARSSKSRRSER